MAWHLLAGMVPGSPSTGNGLGVWTCAVAGCRRLPVDWRAGPRWRGLDGQGRLLASQRGEARRRLLDPLREHAAAGGTLHPAAADLTEPY